MQDYNTIIGVIQMRQNACSYTDIQNRYHIGSSTVTLIMSRFSDSKLSFDEFKQMEPAAVEKLIYPPVNLRHKDIPLPDFQLYYNRIHAPGSRVNIAYCWIDYKQANPDGYEQTQFYELYNRFVLETYGKPGCKDGRRTYSR